MNKMFVSVMFTMAAVLNFTACSTTPATNTKPTEQSAVVNSKTETVNANSKPTESVKTNSNVSGKESATQDKTACLNAKIDGKKLIPSQTFAFDYEPFPKSCFVTFANKEDMLDGKDLPRSSTFYIFTEGKQVYKFDDAFDGQPACWVEGVGFEDLNSDKKTDVIVAGKCLAAKDSYSVNAIYANIGDKFKTTATANQSLENFTSVKQISDFVKKNQNKFFSDK